MATTIVTVEKNIVKDKVKRLGAKVMKVRGKEVNIVKAKDHGKSPVLTLVSMFSFFAASLIFCYAQSTTEWHIEPHCVGITDDELVI